MIQNNTQLSEISDSRKPSVFIHRIYYVFDSILTIFVCPKPIKDVFPDELGHSFETNVDKYNVKYGTTYFNWVVYLHWHDRKTFSDEFWFIVTGL